MMTVSRPMLGEFYNFVQSAYDLVVNLLSGPSFFSVVSRLFAYSSLCAFAIKRDGTDALSSAFFSKCLDPPQNLLIVHMHTLQVASVMILYYIIIVSCENRIKRR